MADFIAGRSAHKTLSATTADRVMLTQVGIMEIVVANLSAAAAMYVTVGKSNSLSSLAGPNLPATPVSAADDTIVVPPSATRLIPLESIRRDSSTFFAQRGGEEPVVVAVVGNGNAYGVEGLWSA